MRNFLLILLLLTSTLAYSQNKSTPLKLCIKPIEERSLIDIYSDSLVLCKQRLDSLMKENAALKGKNSYGDSRYARLFTPVNFYTDLAHRHFSLDWDDAQTNEDQALIDDALMNVYIYHPEYVKSIPSSEKKKDEKVKNDEEKKKAEVVVDNYIAPKAEEMALTPVDIVVKRPNFWTFSGELYLQGMQNYYSKNWYQGGQSTYSGLSRLTLRANYNNKQKFKWENTVELSLGLQKNDNDTVHTWKTTSDLIRYTLKLGLQATNHWYYTFQAVTSTQFMKGYKADLNTDVLVSEFMGPFNQNVSLGMDYSMNWLKGKLTGSVHLAPFAVNYKSYDRLELAEANGFDEDKHSKIDFGSTFTMDCTWNFSSNVNWHTRLYAFTSYKRMEMQWENTINLKIGKFLAASIYFYPRFDDSNIGLKDDKFGYFQLKEYTSFGLTYQF